MAGQGIFAFRSLNDIGADSLIVLDDDAVSSDAALAAYLEGLNGGTGDDDYLGTGRGRMLWATRIDSTGDGGSAYIVSAEVAKRVKARRYP